MDYTDLGMECFYHQRPSLTGSIKLQSSDFRVYEIDLHGNTAGLRSETKVNANNVAGYEVDTEKHNKSEHTDKDVISSENESWARIVQNIPKYLKEIIGYQLYEDICKINPSSVEKESHVLGIFSDKFIRSTIHETVRYDFPFITINSVQQDNGNVMTCYVDEKWNFIFQIVNCVEIPNKILQFVYCRKLTTCMDSWNGISCDIDVCGFDKTARQSLHHCIAHNFGKLIESKTIKKNGSNFISLRFKPKKLPQKRKRSECISVTLYKDNMELLTVLHELSIELKIHLSNLKYAGIKDKKAITQQFISITDVTMDEIEYVMSKTYNRGWSISEPYKTESCLQLGNLSGNFFKIIIRNVDIQGEVNASSTVSVALKESMEKAMNCVQRNGFINYFGVQRFGEEKVTAKIGLYLLKENYMGAIDLLLCPHTQDETIEDRVESSKRCFTEQKDIKAALKLMPYYKTRERLVLQALNRYCYTKDGCQKAIQNIPHASRLFYVHSYCSLIWNKVITARIKKHGFQVLSGDLVQGSEKHEVQFVTDEDVRTNRYEFSDVIYPLPGYSVSLPRNDTQEIYERLLSADSITLNHFRMRKLGLNVPGAYRTVLVKPRDLKFNWIGTQEKENCTDIHVEFTLPSSSYATMLVRELMQSRDSPVKKTV